METKEEVTIDGPLCRGQAAAEDGRVNSPDRRAAVTSL
jgi:hypothetical protein